YLLLQEYMATTIPYCKRQFRYILVTLLVVTFLYMLFGFQDPIQVYQLYTAEYLWFNGMSYANPSLSLGTWMLVTVVCLVLLVVGFWNLRNYNRMNVMENNEDVSLARKIDTATTGASVFVHSIKNQLLSTRVVHKKIQQEFDSEAPRLEKLQEYTDMLRGMNDTMLQRMEDLYQSVKSNYISLVPVTADQIVQRSLDRFLQKYPEGKVEIILQTNAPVLADLTHLCEAIYNLLTNAWDATMDRPDGKVELVVHSERMYIVFEVRDNGCGISRQEQKRIFDPFYTSKNTNFNWGMGLHYVRQIVKSHIGVLRMESVEGKGTSFFVMLPRYAPRHAKGYYKGPKEEITDDTSADC
ncbi:MAG: HAMP domain-containing sensor histidine kinase, partial [Angelakisella sp.]